MATSVTGSQTAWPLGYCCKHHRLLPMAYMCPHGDGSYPSTEVQLVYSIAPANRATERERMKEGKRVLSDFIGGKQKQARL